MNILCIINIGDYMKKLLIKTAGLLPNQKNKMFLGLDINKIKNGLNKKYDLPKTKKTVESFNELLTMDIKKSRLNMPFLNKQKKVKKFKSNNLNNCKMTLFFLLTKNVTSEIKSKKEKINFFWIIQIIK